MLPRVAAAVVVLIGVAGCATPPAPPPAPDRVVLLPAPDGKVGRVVLSTKAGERTLDSAYAGAEVGVDGKIEARTESESSVRQRYGATLDAQPLRPVSFRVYFVSGSDELTPESKPVIAELKRELARRPAPEITVIGHTDRVGTMEANDALSLRRAEAVRKILVEQGVPAAAIETAGRGEREPLIPTAEEVAEAMNRRVEIDIR